MDTKIVPGTATVSLPGTVEKVIKSLPPGAADIALISLDGPPGSYRELRIDGTLQNQDGETVSLDPGAHVKVTVEAATASTTPK